MIIEAEAYNYIGESGCKLNKTYTIRYYHRSGYAIDVCLKDKLLLASEIFEFKKFVAVEHHGSSLEIEIRV